MTAESCREWRELLGAHALGGLDDGERAALEAHLEGCPECRAEHAELAPMAELLLLADPRALESVPVPSTSLGRRIASRVEGERREAGRRRLRFGLAIGAAAALATAAVLAVLLLSGGSTSAPAGTRVQFAQVPHGVHIAAHLAARPYGSQVDVYVRGIQRDTRCVVTLRGRDGRAVSAGSFLYTYKGDAGADLSAAIALRNVRAIAIRAGNRTFVQPVPGSA